MSYRNYFFLLIFLILSLLCIVASISYFVDPDNIYHPPGREKNNLNSEFVEDLLQSKTGLLFGEGKSVGNSYMNISDIKMEIARQKEGSDCVIYGSSTALQFSSLMAKKVLVDHCQSIMNLSLPGSTIEDFLAITWTIVNKSNSPKKIIFALIPEHFSKTSGNKVNWIRYKDYVKEILSVIPNSFELEDVDTKYLTNLINPRYFEKALKKIGNEPLSIIVPPEFNYTKGISSQVLLSDGSLVYSKEYIRIMKDTPIKKPKSLVLSKSNGNFISRKTVVLQKTEFNSDGRFYSQSVVKVFKDLIRFLKKRGHTVYFLMTPFHPEIWQNSSDSAVVLSSIQIESLLHSIGKELNVNILGSYDPDRVGCVANEFYDLLHVNTSCLEKIKELYN